MELCAESCARKQDSYRFVRSLHNFTKRGFGWVREKAPEAGIEMGWPAMLIEIRATASKVGRKAVVVYMVEAKAG